LNRFPFELGFLIGENMGGRMLLPPAVSSPHTGFGRMGGPETPLPIPPPPVLGRRTGVMFVDGVDGMDRGLTSSSSELDSDDVDVEVDDRPGSASSSLLLPPPAAPFFFPSLLLLPPPPLSLLMLSVSWAWLLKDDAPILTTSPPPPLPPPSRSAW
jgi:hypothetical protein